MSDVVKRLKHLAKYSSVEMSSEELTGIAEEIAALRARLAKVERERDDLLHDLERLKENETNETNRAERAEAALATARRVADDAIKMCEDGYPVSAYNVALQVVRALPMRPRHEPPR